MTPDTLRNLKPADVVRDHVVRGLWARSNSGAVSFYYLYRWAGQRRNPKIGEWPSMTISQARDLCREIHKQVLLGHDPKKQQDADRTAGTVNDLADRYLKVHAPKKKTADEDRRMLERYVRPVLGKMRVAEVRAVDIEDLHQRFADRTAQGNRILALLSKMFNLAEKWEMRPQGSNPCRHIDRYPEGKRLRYMTRDEAAAVVSRLRFYEARYPQQAAFLWLLIYTGARPSEIAALRPEHLEGSRIVLAEHKTDKSTGRARIIQLPPQAVAMLEALPRI
ncbi:MAG: tyrosine-type recombinase/integrase, partial [bacterium]